MSLSPLASCKEIAKSFGGDPLFEKITLGIFPGERLGLIGANGSGKSTLLKLLAGLEEADEGELVFQKGIKRVYLSQRSDFSEASGLVETLSPFQPLWEEAKVIELLEEAKFPDLNKKVGELSGGWKKRLHILTVLIQEPDLLFLDEPTNHLDLEGIIWLEELLRAPAFAFVLVSHDRAFLERGVSRLLELSHHYEKGFFEVQGGYADFIERKALYLEGMAKQESSIRNKAKREKEWLGKGPQARTTKARYRIDEAHRLQAELRRLKGLNRAQAKAGIEFVHTARNTKRLVEAYNLGKSLGGSRLFEGLKFKLGPGDRLGLLGPNGSGKSSLMRLVQGELEPDQGRVKRAADLRVIYFDQNRGQINSEETLYRALCPEGDAVVYQGKSIHVYSWARRFLFAADRLEQPVGSLSGGEQARVLIAQLMLSPADLLLLDEPTNDLDIPALEVLEEALSEFPGAIILVTHDRFLLQQVSTQILALDGQGGAGFFPDFDQWQSRQNRPLSEPNREGAALGKGNKSGLSYEEQKELKKIEERIHKQELRWQERERALLDPDLAGNPAALQEAYEAVRKEKDHLEELYARWEDLETRSSQSQG